MASMKRSKVVSPDGDTTQPSLAEPPVAVSPAVMEERSEPRQKIMAKVRLIVGKSCSCHGLQFELEKPKLVADPKLIELFQADGNFRVEVLK